MNALAGTGRLVRLILRRDRFVLPLWAVLFAVIPLSLVSAFTSFYPTVEARRQLADTAGTNPVFLAFLGPIYSSNLGALVAWRGSAFLIAIGVVSLLTVIRHTRTEEEAGRRELLGSTVVGRQVGLAAAMIVATGANLVLAIVIGLGMTGRGLPAAGSFTLGLQYAAAGCIFAGVGAFTAQLANRSGTARALAFGVLGLSFLLRVAGDVSSYKWLSWLTPLGWTEAIRPYDGERWWIFALVAGSVLVLALGASVLLSRRDLGAGFLPQRPGRASAAPGFRSPAALAWRLHRNLLFGWAITFAVLGGMLGSVAASLADLIKSSPQMQALIGRLGGSSVITDAYFAGTAGMFALVAGGYAIQASLRMRSEETSLHGELVLATSVGRIRWAASHLLFAFAGPAAVLAALGLAAGLVHGMNVNDIAGQSLRILAGAIVQLPAVWTLSGLAIFLFGLFPRYAGFSWGALAIAVFLGQLGAVLQFPRWALDVSPFTHIPRVPGGEFNVMPLIILLGIAAMLTAAGLVGFRRRDFGRG